MSQEYQIPADVVVKDFLTFFGHKPQQIKCLEELAECGARIAKDLSEGTALSMNDKLKATQVFTPAHVGNQMLDMLEPASFDDESTYFFEPSCGNGDLLEPILERMIEHGLKKYDGDMCKAMAETLTRFYAVELDPVLVVACRTRIFQWCFAKLERTKNLEAFAQYLVARTLQNAIEHKDFFVAMGLNPVARKLKGQTVKDAAK
jgi:hypothetical protein